MLQSSRVGTAVKSGLLKVNVAPKLFFKASPLPPPPIVRLLQEA